MPGSAAFAMSQAGPNLWNSMSSIVIAGGTPNNFMAIRQPGVIGFGVSAGGDLALGVNSWFGLLRNVANPGGYRLRVIVLSGNPAFMATSGAAFNTFFDPASNGGINDFNLFNPNAHTTNNATWQVDLALATGLVIIASTVVSMTTQFP